MGTGLAAAGQGQGVGGGDPQQGRPAHLHLADRPCQIAVVRRLHVYFPMRKLRLVPEANTASGGGRSWHRAWGRPGAGLRTATPDPPRPVAGLRRADPSTALDKSAGLFCLASMVSFARSAVKLSTAPALRSSVWIQLR